MSEILSEDMLFMGTIPSETALLKQATNQIDTLATNGLQPKVDPDVADYMAAFDEDALSPEEAEASIHDVDLETGVVVSLESDFAGEAA